MINVGDLRIFKPIFQSTLPWFGWLGHWTPAWLYTYIYIFTYVSYKQYTNMYIYIYTFLYIQYSCIYASWFPQVSNLGAEVLGVQVRLAAGADGGWPRCGTQGIQWLWLSLIHPDPSIYLSNLNLNLNLNRYLILSYLIYLSYLIFILS